MRSTPAPAAEPLEVTIVAHDVSTVGGMEMQLNNLIESCLARGVHVTVIARVCRIDPRPGLRIVRVRGPSRPFVLAYPWFMVVGGLLVRRHRRGLLHVTGAIVPNRADVATLHYCHHAVAQMSSEHRVTRTNRLYALNARIAARMSIAAERWCYREHRLRQLIAISAGGAREAQLHFPALSERITIIPHGVDHATFAPDEVARDATRRRLGIGPDELVALFVGGDWPRKGLTHAIDALRSAPGWELVVAGLGDRSGYEARAKAVGVGDRVRFLGVVARPAPLYAAADAFVFPSLYETFSLVAHEAAASGLPLVASRVNGVEDLVEDDVNGWLVERRSDAIAVRLRALAGDEALRRRLGSAAREASLRFSWDEAVAAHLSLYTRLGHDGDALAAAAPATEPAVDVACLATQGADSRDGLRIRALLAPLQPRAYEFRRGRSAARSGLRVLWRIGRERPTVVVMEGTGVGGGLALLAARLLFGTRYVVSSGDAVGPYMSGRRRAYGLPFGMYERLLYRMSAGVVGWTPYLAGRALTFGAPRAITAAGWAAPHDEPDDGALRDQARAELGIPADALVFGLVGSLDWNRRYGYCYGLELIRALRVSPRTDIRVLVVGDGTGLAHLQREGGDDPRLLLPGQVPREEVSRMLAAMDIASLPQSVDGVGSFRYTTKLSEYLAAGLPIVTGRIPLAYDLDDGWLWRLPGDLPWGDTYRGALTALMDSLTADEIQRRRALVPRTLEIFDETRQRERVTAFVREIATPER